VTKKPKQQLIKTSNVQKTKPNVTKAWKWIGPILQLWNPHWAAHGTHIGQSNQ